MTSSQADERRAKALELHLAGATYDAIAKAVGYASRSGAHKAVQEALAGLGQYGPRDVAETELARLDAMLTGLWPKARRGDVQAIDRVLKIGERRQVLISLSAMSEVDDGKTQETGLSDFERRLAERHATDPRRSIGGG